MNTLKKKILSVLLLAFTFFVVHDYVIDKACENVKSIHYSAVSTDELIVNIHEHIHMMFQINVQTLSPLELVCSHCSPKSKDYVYLSSLIYTLNKPPVI
ncbi:MAG: hypothetical protein Q9M32_01100 [Sulfurimonas sp.]|nr:hypothetical protein [Sulfurimonas sp.]MDQ7059759.1 hypothetical protein [Sulfurimonas sp.]